MTINEENPGYVLVIKKDKNYSSELADAEADRDALREGWEDLGAEVVYTTEITDMKQLDVIVAYAREATKTQRFDPNELEEKLAEVRPTH